MERLTELLGYWNHSLPEKVDYADLVCAPAFARGNMMVYEDEYGYMVEDTIKSLEELQQYRNTGLTQEQIREMDRKCIDMFGVGLMASVEKFGEFFGEITEYIEYQRAKEEARLHIIPDIKLHKTLYWIWAGEIMPVNYSGINGGCIDDKGKFHITCKMRTKKERTFTHKRKDIVIKKGDERCFYADNIGKDVFLSRKEAEAKLAEMEGGNE